MDESYNERLDSEMKKVPVNNIIPFSAVDGSGNRTAIFLQGCNIDCKYCHNPETRSVCVDCMECINVCSTGALYVDGIESKQVRYNKKKCVECDECIRICKHDASPKVEWLDAKEVFKRVKKQIPFISGVTVSGGECMLYPEFIEELFRYCQSEGLSTLIDSNGTISFKSYHKLLKVTDGVMLDIKAFHLEDSYRVTGFDNKQVLENVVFLASQGKLEEIRTVIVEELFDGKEVIHQLAKLLSKHEIDISKLRYKLIAFRLHGVRKQYQNYRVPTEEVMIQLKKYANQVGFKEIIII